MIERYLIEHCSPTLASLKTANLFTAAVSSEQILLDQLSAWNRNLSGKGIFLLTLRYRKQTALIYVCRRSRLEADLQRPGVARFLSGYGYEKQDVDYALNRLKERLEAEEGFPHEIGLFLGYPLGDVIGFIQNAGKNSKCTGYWKVYCNVCEAVQSFARYKKCKEVYRRLWKQGRSVWQLTVAA